MADSDPKPDQNPASVSGDRNGGRAPDVARTDAAGGVVPEQSSQQEGLTAEISPDVQGAVQEFMAEAAQQNEAAAGAVAEAGGAGGDTVAFPGSPANGDAPAPYIAFDNVNKSFGSVVVLKDVSFYVLPGETLCILGRSGVGKSVSLQILMGFLRADSGKVFVAGEDICGFDEKQLQAVRRKVTMVFQNGALFDSITVGENVAFPLRERHDLQEDQIQQIVKGMLEMVGVAGMEHLQPSDLSTGMKRSVAIARALASQPEAVLYDEPTTMVDPLMGHLLGGLIERLKTQLHLTSIVRPKACRSGRLPPPGRGTILRHYGRDGSD
jgi:phospholipid/cholesterol/gamma-HCH transport system ATP-binding protein